MKSQEESHNLSELADAFEPLVLAMINDPDIIFSRPAELRYQQPQISLKQRKKTN